MSTVLLLRAIHLRMTGPIRFSPVEAKQIFAAPNVIEWFRGDRGKEGLGAALSRKQVVMELYH